MLADIGWPIYIGTIKALALSRRLMHARLLWCLRLHMGVIVRLLRLRRCLEYWLRHRLRC